MKFNIDISNLKFNNILFLFIEIYIIIHIGYSFSNIKLLLNVLTFVLGYLCNIKEF